MVSESHARRLLPAAPAVVLLSMLSLACLHGLTLAAAAGGSAPQQQAAPADGSATNSDGEAQAGFPQPAISERFILPAVLSNGTSSGDGGRRRAARALLQYGFFDGSGCADALGGGTCAGWGAAGFCRPGYASNGRSVASDLCVATCGMCAASYSRLGELRGGDNKDIFLHCDNGSRECSYTWDQWKSTVFVRDANSVMHVPGTSLCLNLEGGMPSWFMTANVVLTPCSPVTSSMKWYPPGGNDEVNLMYSDGDSAFVVNGGCPWAWDRWMCRWGFYHW